MASKQHGPGKEGEDESPAIEPATIPPTRGAFRKGALLALLLIVPGHSALLHYLAHAPLALSMAFAEVFATVAVFAGLPALLAFGGIGKNLARQSNRKRAPMMLRGALLGALAAISIAVLAAVPTATLPTSPRGTVVTMGAAACIGAVTGALLGLWIHFSRKRATPTSAAGEA